MWYRLRVFHSPEGTFPRNHLDRLKNDGGGLKFPEILLHLSSTHEPRVGAIINVDWIDTKACLV